MKSVACFTGPMLDSSFVLNDAAAPSGMDDVTQDTGIRDERAFFFSWSKLPNPE